VTEIVGKELAHTAYRRCRVARVDEVDGALSRHFLVLKVIEEVIAVAFPFRRMTSMTLLSDQLRQTRSVNYFWLWFSCATHRVQTTYHCEISRP
jgi:hypothetical protein